MKKISFLFTTTALFLLTAVTTQAQIGIKAGATLSSLSQDAFFNDAENITDNSLWGIQAGLFAELPLGDFFSIQPEILWMQKGGNTEFDIADSGINQDYRINYIEIPVLAKIKTGTTDDVGVGLFFYGGPFISYALNGKISNEITFLDDSIENEDIDIDFDEDNQRRIDWGAAFGLGVNLGNLMLDLRYDLGINNLLDDEFEADEDDEPYLRTRSIGLTLGYRFGGM